ncbi:hypothetical protein GLAREA_00021 [Glarea lozoyensis ATCC 20868]|uniref:2EXR domain-containing protein n=1 Tax=Glarea lozoyensis (strain ATCC 20868 / MF5171) TaxID=1116229 RepID=S3DQX9_GLAL2|nr:uncharacterized protein GLAREA_00021 [Glarea lozoyensis ATCC 20868]EPE28863.1 hypothetical protein GLAREA_00021 [Glarea lozoyensis ATCC 20868]
MDHPQRPVTPPTRPVDNSFSTYSPITRHAPKYWGHPDAWGYCCHCSCFSRALSEKYADGDAYRKAYEKHWTETIDKCNDGPKELFTLFPKLPDELQFRIIEFALPRGQTIQPMPKWIEGENPFDLPFHLYIVPRRSNAEDHMFEKTKPFTNPALLQVNRKIRAELQKKFTLLTLRVGEDKKKFPDHDVDLMAYFDYKCDNVSFLEACYSRQLVDCGPTAAETPLTEFEKHVQHITIRRQVCIAMREWNLDTLLSRCQSLRTITFPRSRDTHCLRHQHIQCLSFCIGRGHKEGERGELQLRKSFELSGSTVPQIIDLDDDLLPGKERAMFSCDDAECSYCRRNIVR